MDEAKIYGLCLERLKHQIRNAKQRRPDETRAVKMMLEGYKTGDLDEIIDILELELHGVEKTGEALSERLDDLAYTVSVLCREQLVFAYDDKSELCLYLDLPAVPVDEPASEMAAVA